MSNLSRSRYISSIFCTRGLFSSALNPRIRGALLTDISVSLENRGAMRLAQLYQDLDDDGRKALAASVCISPGYLWQIATQWKGKKPSLDLLGKFVEAEPRLTATDLVAEFTAKPARAGAEGAVVHEALQ